MAGVVRIDWECKDEMREGLGQEAVADVHGADE